MKSLALLFCAVLGLTVRAADLPPINTPASAEHFPGKFIWADLFTGDQDAAQKFYTGLFGWTASPIDRTSAEQGEHSYIVLYNGDRPVAGIALRPHRLKDESRGHWVGYVSVDDVPKALAAATAAGGSVIFPSKNLPQRGSQAIFLDGEGAMLGVMHSSSGDPAEYRPDPGDWTWAELFARNTAAASQYYQAVLGYDAMPDLNPGRDNAIVFASGGYSRASLHPLPPRPNARPAWLLFVRVESVKDTVSKVEGLGGRVLVSPKEIHGKSWLAIIADPVGAAIGIVELEDPDSPVNPTPPVNPAPPAKEQP